MTTNKDDGNQGGLTPEKLTFILAIAGRLDALSEKTKHKREQITQFAVKADTTKMAYYPFAFLDGLNLSYSMFKYYVDAILADETLNLHDLMLTPENIAAISAESIFIIGFSFLAAHFEEINGEYANKFKEFIVTAWPYARDVMKTLKNSYKGLRSTMIVAAKLGEHHFISYMVPATLIFSLVAAANRFWLRDMFTKRSNYSAKNKKLLKEILSLKQLSEEERQQKLNQICAQSRFVRSYAYAAVGFNAFADGMYYYIGMLSLASFSASLMLPLLAICIFYSLSCIATRLYEEYNYQHKLIKTQVDCQINLLAKRLESLYVELSQQSDNEALIEEWEDLLDQFDDKRKELIKLCHHSYKSAILIGLNQGLYAYGTLTCALFIVCLIFAICQVAFPPLALATFMIAGLAIIALSISKALIQNYAHNYRLEQSQVTQDEYTRLRGNLDDQNVQGLTLAQFQQALKDGLNVDPGPQSNLVSWYEIFRSFFSGIGKGQKITDFTLNPLMEPGDNGEYHETAAIYGVMAVSCVIFSITRAIRALAKGIGRPMQGKTPTPKANKTITNSSFEKPAHKDLITRTRSDTLSRASSVPDNLSSGKGFFGKKPQKNPIQYNTTNTNTNRYSLGSAGSQ